MINNSKVLCIIPARNGSKGLPKKNIMLLAGKPLIHWSIQSALHSKYIDETIVSTDSHKIASISKKSGATVPFLRPASLATSKATTKDVIIHAINQVERKGQYYKYIVLLQPTSPLRTHKDIDESIEYLKNKSTKAVVSVCETEHNPLWINTLLKNKKMNNFVPKFFKNKNRQQLPKYYRINGAIYVSDISYFKENNGFIGDNTIAYIMPQLRSVDIDTILDFKLAEIIKSGL